MSWMQVLLIIVTLKHVLAPCILLNTLLKHSFFKLQFTMQALLLLAISPGNSVREWVDITPNMGDKIRLCVCVCVCVCVCACVCLLIPLQIVSVGCSHIKKILLPDL